MMVDRIGPAATCLSRFGVARRPSAFLQCDRRAIRLRRCRWRMCRTNLRRGARIVCDRTQKTRRTSSTVISGYFFPQPVPFQNQPMMRQEYEHRMAMPAGPGTSFIVPKPGLVLALTVALFDRPSRESGPQKILDRYLGTRITLEVFDLRFLIQRFGDEKPALATVGFALAMEFHPKQCRADSNGAFASVADLMLTPGSIGQCACDLVDTSQARPPASNDAETVQSAYTTTYSAFGQGDPHSRAARNFQDVAFSVFMKPVVQPRRPPEFF